MTDSGVVDGRARVFPRGVAKLHDVYWWRLIYVVTRDCERQCSSYNRAFPSSLFQNESKCETFLMMMSSACSFIFIRMVLHVDSLWNRGTRKLGNGLLDNKYGRSYNPSTHWRKLQEQIRSGIPSLAISIQPGDNFSQCVVLNSRS